jgi:hypothetical protein
MREVPVLLFRSMRRMLERYGIQTAPCLEELALARVPAWAIGGRVDRDELAIFLERCSGRPVGIKRQHRGRRGAPLARRDDRRYFQYRREEQRPSGDGSAPERRVIS